MLILYVIMSNIIKSIEDKFKKPVIDVRPSDTVRVNQRIQEGTKTRVQMFEGLVIRVTRKNSLSYRILVRNVASGVGVEKSFLLHAPNIEKVEIVETVIERKELKKVEQILTEFDPEVFYVVEDVRVKQKGIFPEAESMLSRWRLGK